MARFPSGKARGFSFRSLFAGQSTREELVATFLALLELMRLRKIRVVQKQEFGDIWIGLGQTEETPEGRSIISEETL